MKGDLARQQGCHGASRHPCELLDRCGWKAVLKSRMVCSSFLRGWDSSTLVSIFEGTCGRIIVGLRSGSNPRSRKALIAPKKYFPPCIGLPVAQNATATGRGHPAMPLRNLSTRVRQRSRLIYEGSAAVA